MLLAILLASSPLHSLALDYEFFASGHTFLESQSFNLSPHNMPTVSYAGSTSPLQLITDTQYYATTDITGSTYTPESTLSSAAIRVALGMGWDLRPTPSMTLRSRIYSAFGDRSLVNARYYFYNPSGGTTNTQITESGFALPNTLANGAEMISWVQKPSWSMSVASLFRLSDRYSLGPSYSFSQSSISSSEYLLNTSSTSYNSPFYVGHLSLTQHSLGALWTYRLNPQTQLHCGIESSKQFQVAQKELYFNYDQNQNITGRALPTSTTSTDSNWNGISCSDNTCTCVGSDCALNQAQNYDAAPYLNLDRLITRISLGFDFSLSHFEPGF